MMNRRSFLKLSAINLAAASLSRRQSGLARSAEGVVYDGRFVPEGAESRVAFVSDHHYWPGHLENWGGGAQITTNCERRMPDLIEVLNEEHPDLSIHAGDVISAGGAFFPPPEEYTRQLAFARSFYDGLKHPFMPLIGNHESPEARVVGSAQYESWIRHFGATYRCHDVKGWRLVGLNCMLPNPGDKYGKGDAYGNVCGLDDAQLQWLSERLREAADRGLKVVICSHVQPLQWINLADFEKVIVAPGCVKAVMCGHSHRNQRFSVGGIPVLVRVSNVSSPFGFSMLHLYPDGRMIVVQKSQHFPFDDFISSGFQSGAQGTESDRYLTLGGTSELPLGDLRTVGAEASAAISDGHLRLSGGAGRAVVLIDTARLRNARLSLTAVKTAGERMGAIALAEPDGGGGVEATLTSRYSPDGKVYVAENRGTRRVLARSWFNIGDNIAYRLILEVRDGQITASWKNMLSLRARVDPDASGHFGFFVERGTMFVTDLKLERL